MKSRHVAGLIAIFAVVGLWQVGHGVWIYVKAQLAQYLLQQAWVRTLNDEQDRKPWPWADTWPLARMQVPNHGVDLLVLAGASGRTLAFGPGHASSSALPGQSGTTVISGHRDTHFRFLAKLKSGDEIVVQMPGHEPYRYHVIESQVVEARSTNIINHRHHAYLALVTCYPFDAILAGGTLRYVVTAEMKIAQGGAAPDKNSSESVMPGGTL